jgi:hypothetical protein
MKNKFFIKHKDREVMVEQHAADQYNNTFFTVHLPEEPIVLEYTEDDEGAGRWLDRKSHHQTELSAELGHLIDLYYVQQKENI